MQTVVEGVLPERLGPVGQVVTAPDVVDQQVEPPVLLGAHLLDESLDIGGDRVIGPDRDAAPARRGHPLGRLFDRLGPIDLGPDLPRAPAAAVDRRSRCAELDRDGAAGATGGTGDDRDLS